jgi:RHS repeat-associated protein
MRLRLSFSWLLVTALALPTTRLLAQTPVTPPMPYSSAIPKNYVRVWEATAPEQDPLVLVTRDLKDVRQTTQYYDGLGRPLQTVIKKGSLSTDPANPVSAANAVDMVSAIVYDELGRQQYQYLPFAASGSGSSDGLLKLNPFQQQSTFATAQYPGETFFYAKTNFEASPLNRVTDSYAAGNSWAGSESNPDANTRRSISLSYLINDLNDSVRVWSVSGASFSTGATYGAGQLFENVSTDEHKNKVVEYKDKSDRLILKKVQVSSTPSEGHEGWLCTYYVYDDIGRLRGVLQPKAVETLLKSGWTVTATIVDELCFRYQYDERGRMMVKQVPGAGEVRIVYDQWDRPVLTQDANLRASNKWLFTKYDQLNRPVMTGFYTNTTYTAQSAMQGYLNSQNMARYENYQTATFPLYSLTQSFPAVAYSDVLTVTYYDDYSWTGWYGPISTRDNTWDNEFASASNITWPYPQPLTQSSQTKGLVTGVWDKTAGGLLTTTYYDDKARVIQTRTINYSGGTDFMTIQYSFSGQVLQTVLRHQKGGTNPQTHTVQTRMNYDEPGRLMKIEKKLNSTIGAANLSKDWYVIAAMEYDGLGQLKKKTLAPGYSASGLDTLTHVYNIRGWLTSINKGYVNGATTSWFGVELGYDKDGFGPFASKQFNGNISGTIWRSRGDGEKRKYDFTYDAASRLMTAGFTQAAGSGWDKSAGIDYSMKMGDGNDPFSAYDANGNIRKMSQRGWKIGGSVTVDSLLYKAVDYSNKLKYVRDAANDFNTALGDFKESAQNNSDNAGDAADYSFDANGNLTLDNNKSITAITYNHLNLPVSISVASKGWIEYVYDNIGNKLKKVVHETGKPDKSTLYLAGFVYENDTLQLFQHEVGRIRLTTDANGVYNGYGFDYFEKDHLGNVRVVLTDQRDTARYPEASMETAKLGRDTLYYSKIQETRVTKPTGYPTDTYTNPNDWVASTRGDGSKIGPGIVLKVMAGDKFNLRVSSWYKLSGAPINQPVDPVSDLVAALIGGIGGAGKFGVGELQTSSVLSPGVTNFLTGRSDSAGRPRAYVNWILFDEQLKYVSSSSGFEQVPDESYFNNTTTPRIKVHDKYDLPVSKSGYLYIYVSNETPGIDVFFDNLQVTHFKGPLLEETHYYPFGLTMAGISSRAIGKPENRIKLFGKEIQHKEFTDGSGLAWYDYGMREYDHQIGRFFRIDPISEKFYELSTYQYCSNDPIKNVDLDGAEGLDFRIYNKLVVNTVKNPNSNSAKVLGAVTGVGGAVADVATGTVNAVKHPIQTLKGVGRMLGQRPEDFAVNYGLNLYCKYGNAGSDAFTTYAMGAHVLTDIAFALSPAKAAFAKTASVWELAPVSRGFTIEGLLGGNLPKAFPVIDKFADGIATSIKSIDLTAETYSKGNNLLNTLKGYVNKLDDFTQGSRDGVRITSNQITSKVLEVAIQPGKASLSQWEQIGKAMQYAKNNGIGFNLQFIK